MRCFAISDFHLSFQSNKPMDKFGPQWRNHWEKLEENWLRCVSQEDVVLLPGDHSWALKLEEAQQDLEFIARLPGRKILSRGNHDYWWQSLSKIRQAHPDLTFLQNDAVNVGSMTIGGTRGWLLPPANASGRLFSKPDDEKLYLRELERLKLSLERLDPKQETRIILLHYPPLYSYQKDTGFTDLLSEFKVDYCVYGHLHSHHAAKQASWRPFNGVHNGVNYQLVACDQLDFKPLLLLDLPEGGTDTAPF